MQYSQETREQALTLLREGAAVSDVHEFLNIPTSTIYRWRDENSRETQPNSHDSQEKLEQVCRFLKKFSTPQIRADIAAVDKALSDSMGTFSEKMHQGKLNRLKELLDELEAL